MYETVVKFAKGDWVFHPRMPGWGYGKVLGLIGDTKGRVFFLLAGEKRLSWEHAGLGIVEDDEISQGALNEQLAEFKLNAAKDLLLSEELSKEVMCKPCDSFSSRCELCKGSSESLRIYSLSQKGQMCLCDLCRDKIMLETKDRAEINQSIAQMLKRSKKELTVKAKNKQKLKSV